MVSAPISAQLVGWSSNVRFHCTRRRPVSSASTGRASLAASAGTTPSEPPQAAVRAASVAAVRNNLLTEVPRLDAVVHDVPGGVHVTVDPPLAPDTIAVHVGVGPGKEFCVVAGVRGLVRPHEAARCVGSEAESQPCWDIPLG